MATTLRDTLKGILGTAWHVAHDSFFTALAPASDGTVEANKFIAADANLDVTALRNVTLTGTLVAAALTISGVTGITGALTVTSASANALSVGRLGATTPALQVDASTATSITGIKIKSAATGNGVAISAIGEASNGNLTIDAQGSGTITLGGTSTGAIALARAVTITVGALTMTAGTTTVAPQIFLSGTNLTTAAAGAVEFDGKVFYQTAAASSRQVVVTEQFICLASNYTASDTASAQKVFNSPTNGAVTLAASTAYFFEAVYIISNTGTTSHTWATLFALGGGASVTSIGYTALARTGTTSAVTITALSSLYIAVATQVPVTAASTSATEFVTIFLRGIIRMNAGGTVTPQIQASAQPGLSGTPGVTVLAGSYFRCWPLGADTVASVGNWS